MLTHLLIKLVIVLRTGYYYEKVINFIVVIPTLIDLKMYFYATLLIQDFYMNLVFISKLKTIASYP